jgi:hypothetical protein
MSLRSPARAAATSLGEERSSGRAARRRSVETC